MLNCNSSKIFLFIKKLSNLTISFYLCNFLYTVVHPPHDNFAKRSRSSIDECEIKFEAAVNTFQKFTTMATNYYTKKQNLKFNQPMVPNQAAVNMVTSPTFQDGYEEEIINLFRKIPQTRKREAFGHVMEQMEYIMHEAEVL